MEKTKILGILNIFREAMVLIKVCLLVNDGPEEKEIFIAYFKVQNYEILNDTV